MSKIEMITKNKDLVFDNFQTNMIKSFSTLPIIVIYNKPKDYPDHYVARLFDKDKPTKAIMLKETLEELRKGIPIYMIRMSRSATDDRNIVESYI